ncbi:MAG: pyrroline-5-carboxylate reductase [Candidatus Margulisbacteria bacterium]|nr:pyrroline-5-carboxylate reductase [Candidatus Margulisiibacteriota bacterium]
MTQLGFIGFGKMAQAIYSRADKTHFTAHYYDPHLPQSKITQLPLSQLIETSDLLLLCIKPQSLNDLKNQWPQISLEGKHLVSILAGTTLSQLKAVFGNSALTRVMPNTPALVGQSMSAFTHNDHVTPAQKTTLLSLLKKCGHTQEVPENLMNIITAVSGSGPAFFYKIADAIAKSAQEHTLSYENAITLTAQTMIGAGHMLLEANKTPQTLINDVSSPNGTTVAGLSIMANSPIENILKETINAAYNRAIELSQGDSHAI